MGSGVVNYGRTIRAFMRVFDIPADALTVLIDLGTHEDQLPTITVTRAITTDMVGRLEKAAMPDPEVTVTAETFDVG